MQTPFVVPPLGGIVSVNFRLKPVLQTATQTQCNQIGIKSQSIRESNAHLLQPPMHTNEPSAA